MKIFLEKAIFINAAPFEQLELDFKENEISVLSAVNGKGKTTIISHIVDAFYEMARPNFLGTFENKQNQYYRISETTHILNTQLPSFVYIRFDTPTGKVDYLKILWKSTQEQYDSAISISDKIPFSSFQEELGVKGNIKEISSMVTEEVATDLFFKNILTYFPSYRYEEPGYLNDSYKIKLEFNKTTVFRNHLKNEIETVSSLPSIINWIMDLLLDMRYTDTRNPAMTMDNMNKLITDILISKGYGNLAFGVWTRNEGRRRVQIINALWKTIYPSMFNISSWEASLLSMFWELLRQADNLKTNISLPEITWIVLVDEIDKHLHIKLQKEILPKLLSMFPNVQFIISSHSPFMTMWLAEQAQGRTKIKSLDSWLNIEPERVEEYEDVYNMMVKENERFKLLYDSIKGQIDTSKLLQIVTEGDNNQHIKKALSILAPSLLDKVQIIKWCEGKSWKQQLKNAFEVLSKANHSGKFLFVWDCDAASMVDSIIETDNFQKFCFERNTLNSKADKWIENIYSVELFSNDVYETKVEECDYGGSNTKVLFQKNKFLDKIKLLDNPLFFSNYRPLVSRIELILNSISVE